MEIVTDKLNAQNTIIYHTPDVSVPKSFRKYGFRCISVGAHSFEKRVGGNVPRCQMPTLPFRNLNVNVVFLHKMPTDTKTKQGCL